MVSGPGFSLTKDGEGTLLLSGLSNYDGGTTLVAGTLVLAGGVDTLSTVGALTIAGGKLDLAGGMQSTSGTITFESGEVRRGTLLSTGTAFVAHGGSVSAVLGGPQGFVKGGGGAFTLRGENTFTGGVTLEQGVLNINVAGTALGSPLGTGLLTISGGTLGNTSGAGIALLTANPQLWSGDFSFAGPNDLDLGAGTVTMTGDRTVRVLSGTLSLGGVITGAGVGLTKAGDGTLILSGASTFEGGTNITAGSLVLSGGDDRLSSSGSISITGGALDLGNNGQSTSGTIRFNGGMVEHGTLRALGGGFTAQSGSVTAQLAGSGGLIKDGPGLFWLGGTNSFTGVVRVNAGSLVLSGGAALADTVELSISTPGAVFLESDETVGALSGTGLLALQNHKLTTASSQDSVFSGALTGAGILQKTGAGSLSLDGSSPEFSGVLLISEGTAFLSSGAPLGSGIVNLESLGTLSLLSSGSLGAVSGAGKVLLEGATLTLSGAQNTTLSGVISGRGALHKSGSGELTLTAANQFTGGFTLESGAVRVGNDGALGAGTIYLFGGTLSASDAVHGRAVSNPVVAAGRVTLGDVIRSGSIELSGSVSLYGDVLLTIESPVSILSKIMEAGTFGLVKAGSSRLTLGGASAYSGGTTITAGSLLLKPGTGSLSSIGAITAAAGVLDLGGNVQSTLGAITFSGGVVQNGTLTATGSAFDGQYGSVSALLAGTQALLKSTSGILTLSGANAYLGGTTVSAGSLVLAGGNDRLSTSGSIYLTGGVLDLGANTQSTSGLIRIVGGTVQNGILAATGSDIAAQAGDITAVLAGSQGLTKTTSGVVSLSGLNTYTGTTSVTAGSLSISGTGSLSQNSALAVQGAAQFNYLPATVGTLRVSALSLASGSRLGLDWGGAIASNQQAIASGTVFLSLRGSFVSGQTYTLLSGGVGSQLNAVVFSLDGKAAYDYAVSQTAGLVQLTPYTPSVLTDAYWVGGRPSVNALSWTEANWATNASGTIFTARVPTFSSTVYLGAASALPANLLSMTLGADISIAGLVVRAPVPMSLADDGHLLRIGAKGIFVEGNAGSLSLAAAVELQGAQTWSQRGAGVLSLSGEVALGGYALELSGSGAVVISGSMNGAGALTITGAAQVALRGPNTFTGGTTIGGGSLVLKGGNNRLSSLGAITAGGGVLDLGTTTQITSGWIEISGGTVQNGTLVATGNAFAARSGVVSAVLGGTQGLVKTTAGALTLSGVSVYSGGTTLEQGRLNINNGGTALASAIGTGTLLMKGGTLGNTSGSEITLATQNTQVWRGDFSFAGPSDLNLGTGNVTLGLSPTVTVTTGTLSVMGFVSGGTYGITKTGAGTLILAGGLSWSGPTRVDGGRLELGGNVQLGTAPISLADGAQLVFSLGTADLIIPNKIIGGTVLSLDPIHNVFWDGGTTAQVDLVVPDGVHEVVDTGTIASYVRVSILSGGSFTSAISGPSTLSNKVVLSGSGSGTGTSDVNLSGNQALTMSGTLSGDGTLSKSGEGLLTLSGTNTFTGGSVVREGTLEIVSSNALGTSGVEVTGKGKLALNSGSAGTPIAIANAISGAGAVVVNGGGLVVVTGSSNTFTGGTTIGAGTLEIQHTGALGGSAISIGASASLSVNVAPNERVTLSNPIVGDGYLVKESKGTLSVASLNNTFIGTRLEEGVLEVADASALGRSLALNGGTLSLSSTTTFTVPVRVGGTLKVAPSAGSVTEMTGLFSGNGVLTKTGPGVLQISGTLKVDHGLLEVVNAQSGANGLTKEGAGTLVWRGAGSLEKTAQVQGGTLQVAGDQILRDLTKLGIGKLEVLGNSKFMGTTVLQSGTIAVDRNSALAEVPLLVVGGKDSIGTVLDVRAIPSGLIIGDGLNQTLKGRGSILGSVTIEAYGYLAPGNSIDQLSVGTISFAKGSIYEAEYRVSSGSSQSDLLRATSESGGTGVATLTGGIVRPKAERRLTDFGPHSFPILAASGGITGSFDGIFQTAAIGGSLGYVHSYDSLLTPGTVHSLTMTLQRVPYEKLGGGGMRSQLGAVLDRNLASTEPSLSNMIDTLDALFTAAQVQSVLDRLNPRIYPEVLSLSMSRLQDVQKTVSDRILILGAGAASGGTGAYRGALAAAQDNQWTAWVNGYGSAGAQSSQDLAGGSVNWNNYGSVTAVEKGFGAVTLGFFGALGASSAQMNLSNSKISADSWHLGSYASLPVGSRGFLNFAALYGQAENKIQRTLPNLLTGSDARSTSFSEDWLLQVGMGADIAPKETDWSAVLSAEFACGGVKMGPVRESGIGALSVESGDAFHVSPISRLRFALAKEWRIGTVSVRPEASASWVHNFEATPKPLGMHLQGDSGAEWMVSSEQRSADSVRAAMSVEISLGGRRSMRVYGEEELQQGLNVFRGGVTFTIGF